jgi:hypothetical protein
MGEVRSFPGAQAWDAMHGIESAGGAAGGRTRGGATAPAFDHYGHWSDVASSCDAWQADRAAVAQRVAVRQTLRLHKQGLISDFRCRWLLHRQGVDVGEFAVWAGIARAMRGLARWLGRVSNRGQKSTA